MPKPSTLFMLAACVVGCHAHAAPPGAERGGWQLRGNIVASVDLQPGDSVLTRVFDAVSERPELSTRLVIRSTDEGRRQRWPALLATRINAEQPDLRATTSASDGALPAGSQAVLARDGSRLSRIEIQVLKAPPDPQAELHVSGLRGLAGGSHVEVGVSVVGAVDADVKVFDMQGRLRGQISVAFDGDGRTLRIPLAPGAGGMHQVVVSGALRDHEARVQKTYSVWIESAR